MAQNIIIFIYKWLHWSNMFNTISIMVIIRMQNKVCTVTNRNHIMHSTGTVV